MGIIICSYFAIEFCIKYGKFNSRELFSLCLLEIRLPPLLQHPPRATHRDVVPAGVGPSSSCNDQSDFLIGHSAWPCKLMYC